MFEQQPEDGGIPLALKVFGGFLLGFVVSVFVITFVFATVSGIFVPQKATRFWMAEILNFALLSVGGYLAYRNVEHSAVARGVLIGISVVFLLNAICGMGRLAG